MSTAIKELLQDMIEISNKQGEQIINLMQIVNKQEETIKLLVDYATASQASASSLQNQLVKLRDEVTKFDRRVEPTYRWTDTFQIK